MLDRFVGHLPFGTVVAMTDAIGCVNDTLYHQLTVSGTLGVSYSKYKMLHETGVVVVCILELYVYKTLTLTRFVGHR